MFERYGEIGKIITLDTEVPQVYTPGIFPFLFFFSYRVMTLFQNILGLFYLSLSTADMYASQLILPYGYIERKLKALLKNLFCNNVILRHIFFPLRGQSNLFGGEDPLLKMSV